MPTDDLAGIVPTDTTGGAASPGDIKPGDLGLMSIAAISGQSFEELRDRSKGLAELRAERDAARATAASLEAELAALRKVVERRSEEVYNDPAHDECDHGREDAYAEVLTFMKEYSHGQTEPEVGERGE